MKSTEKGDTCSYTWKIKRYQFLLYILKIHLTPLSSARKNENRKTAYKRLGSSSNNQKKTKAHILLSRLNGVVWTDLYL